MYLSSYHPCHCPHCITRNNQIDHIKLYTLCFCTAGGFTFRLHILHKWKWYIIWNKTSVSPSKTHFVHQLKKLTFVMKQSSSELFPSVIPLWSYRKAQVCLIPGDAKCRHQKDKQHLFTLNRSLAELLPWRRYHKCRLNKAVRCLHHTVILSSYSVLERISITLASFECQGIFDMNKPHNVAVYIYILTNCFHTNQPSQSH